MSARAQERHEALPPLRFVPPPFGRRTSNVFPSLEEHHPALGRIPHDRPHCLHRRFCPGHLAGCCGIARKWTEALAGATRGRHHGPSRRGLGQRLGSALLRRAGQRVLAGRRRANRCRNRRRGTGNAPILHANGQPELLLGDRGDARGGY